MFCIVWCFCFTALLPGDEADTKGSWRTRGHEFGALLVAAEGSRRFKGERATRALLRHWTPHNGETEPSDMSVSLLYFFSKKYFGGTVRALLPPAVGGEGER